MPDVTMVLLVALLALVTIFGDTQAECIKGAFELGPLSKGLDSDINYWLEKLGGRKLNMSDLTLLIGRNALSWNHNPWTQEGPGMANVEFNAVLIKNNKWYFPFREWGYDANCTRGDDWCSERMTHTQQSFYRWARTTKFPDVLFVLDLENGGSCRVEAECPAPILAIFDVLRTEEYKDIDVRVPLGLGSILVPDTSHYHHSQMINRPWGEKARKAIFRGSLHNPQFHVNRLVPGGSRKHITDMVKQPPADHPDAAQLIDAQGWEERDGHRDEAHMENWPDEYSKYLFTLALDGQSGNLRLEELLHINSVVLREFSPVVEYFERALKPNEHYLPILRSSPFDVLDVIKNTSDSDIQRITANAQSFAANYLCDNAKMIYFQTALERYKALFEGMDAYIDEVIMPLVRVKEHLGLGHHGDNVRADS